MECIQKNTKQDAFFQYGLDCMAEGKYTPADSVHHIVKLSIDFDKKLDDDNLISLCRYHHELADKGVYSYDYLISLAKSIPPGAR